jgi:aconitate hydratase
MGSSRDWAAKGPLLLGVQAVIAESYERIHRSNLVGMGILPLQLKPGDTRQSLGLDGTEVYDITGLSDGVKPGEEIKVTARKADGNTIAFSTIARIDSPIDKEYLRHGGILQMVLRNLMKTPASAPATGPEAAATRGGGAAAGAAGSQAN